MLLRCVSYGVTYGYDAMYFLIQNANKCNLVVGVITSTLCVISALLFQLPASHISQMKQGRARSPQ